MVVLVVMGAGGGLRIVAGASWDGSSGPERFSSAACVVWFCLSRSFWASLDLRFLRPKGHQAMSPTMKVKLAGSGGGGGTVVAVVVVVVARRAERRSHRDSRDGGR